MGESELRFLLSFSCIFTIILAYSARTFYKQLCFSAIFITSYFLLCIYSPLCGRLLKANTTYLNMSKIDQADLWTTIANILLQIPPPPPTHSLPHNFNLKITTHHISSRHVYCIIVRNVPNATINCFHFSFIQFVVLASAKTGYFVYIYLFAFIFDDIYLKCVFAFSEFAVHYFFPSPPLCNSLSLSHGVSNILIFLYIDLYFYSFLLVLELHLVFESIIHTLLDANTQ